MGREGAFGNGSETFMVSFTGKSSDFSGLPEFMHSHFGVMETAGK